MHILMRYMGTLHDCIYNYKVNPAGRVLSLRKLLECTNVHELIFWAACLSMCYIILIDGPGVYAISGNIPVPQFSRLSKTRKNL